jgi:flagellar hook assembly protein FlgD
MYVADSGNNRIRVIWGVAPPAAPSKPGETTPPTTTTLADGLGKGGVVAAPNLLDRAKGINVSIAMKGNAAGAVRVRIYSEAGDLVRTLNVTLDGTGAAVVSFDGRNDSNVMLASGVYWAVGDGGGVQGRKAIVIMGKRKR